MPPENTDPVTKTEPNEFDFESAKAENPRIRRRSLKTKPTAESTPESAPAAQQPARTPITPDQPRPAVYAQPVTASGDARPAAVRPSTGEPVEKAQSAPATGVLYYSNNPQKAAGARTTPAAGHPARTSQTSTSPASSQPASARPNTTSMQNPITRPATTSHSAPTRPAATSHAASGHATHATSHATHTPQMSSTRPVTGSVTTPQMSSSRPVTGSAATPQMSSSRPVTGSAATPQTSATRPASASTSSAASSAARTVSTTIAAPASSSRPAGVSDFRGNIDRQSREQKSIGGILNIVVYGLIAFFVIAAILAAYGANDVYKQLHQQSLTVSDLDSRYSATFQNLGDQIKTEYQARKDLEAQVNQSQELAVRQQDTITKLQAALDAETEALRQERATRAAETSIRVSENSALRARVRALEEKNEQPQSYRP